VRSSFSLAAECPVHTFCAMQQCIAVVCEQLHLIRSIINTLGGAIGAASPSVTSCHRRQLLGSPGAI
jgi:hypothetical protein